MDNQTIKGLILSYLDFPKGVDLFVETAAFGNVHLILKDGPYTARFMADRAKIADNSIYLIASARQLLVNLLSMKGIKPNAA